MAQSPGKLGSEESITDYFSNWDALSSMLTRGRSFSGRERNCCFLNLGSPNGKLARFADVSAVSGLDFIDDGRAVIATDWDHDGDLDFWQTNREGPRLRFVKNQLSGESQKQWVAFELTGTSCNRDAIGAVLQLHCNDHIITRTLTAGDGFMSQSGKRIHFGLGTTDPDQALTLTIRWPGSTTETFKNITPGQAYQITQGTGTLQAIEKRPNPIDLPSSQPEVPVDTEQARIILSHRIPSPPLDYVDFTGQVQKHEPDTSGQAQPLLINLWASWCPNCRHELSDFKSNYPDLEAKGLRILAFTVEGVPEGDLKPDVSGAKELVAQSDFPFEVGALDRDGLRLLTILHDRVIARQRPLPLPCSFLIDSSGHLAAIYKGPVEATQIIADLDLLQTDQKTINQHAFPFPAPDGSGLFQLGALDFARAYFAGGDHKAASREARKVIDAPLTGNAEADLANRANAWYFLGTMEQSLRNWTAAAEAYQTALDYSPNQPLLLIPLGVSLWQADQQNEARRIFEEAATAGEKNPSLLNALGKAHLQIKQYQEAVPYFEKAITLAPQQAAYHLDLALAYQTGGDSAKAVELYQKYLAGQPGSTNAKNNLALLLATAPADSVRNGTEALMLAKEVIAQAGESHPSPLDTLGTALAETGDFEGAIAATGKAIEAARAIGRHDLLPKLQAKQDLYRSGKPFRATP
ncbi:tetratricopeptide repeat protein [Verrucomicrobiaceae bacterium 227]